MKNADDNQAGFVPLLITLFLILLAVIVFVFIRVQHGRK
jgi:cbb3-type cytochrome oxidase subunit 3